MKRVNKEVNQDLKNLTSWLNANETCLDVRKTEVVSFKSASTEADLPLTLAHNVKILYPPKLSVIPWCKNE